MTAILVFSWISPLKFTVHLLCELFQQIIVYNGDYGRNGYYLKTVYECDNFIY